MRGHGTQRIALLWPYHWPTTLRDAHLHTTSAYNPKCVVTRDGRSPTIQDPSTLLNELVATRVPVNLIIYNVY